MFIAHLQILEVVAGCLQLDFSFAPVILIQAVDRGSDDGSIWTLA